MASSVHPLPWESRLRQEAAQLRGIIQSAMDAIITVDDSRTIVVFNAAAERVFGCAAEQAIGGPLDRFIPARYRVAHAAHMRDFEATGVTSRNMAASRVVHALRANGDEFPIEASISQAEIDGRRLYTVIVRDVSERLRVHEALERSHREFRELAGMMNEAREAERRRIARELHDELAQLLTALKMDIAWLSARLPAAERHLVTRGEKMKGLVDSTVASVRRISADLRPVMLDDLGLLPSIENLLHSLSERTGVRISLEAETADFEFREPLATGVYRMVQEALTNVARHAQAKAVRVSVSVGDQVLDVRVVDDGIGLAAAPAKHGTYGLMGIRERAQTLGGAARIHSPESGGTVVEITIPLARFAEAGREPA